MSALTKKLRAMACKRASSSNCWLLLMRCNTSLKKLPLAPVALSLPTSS